MLAAGFRIDYNDCPSVKFILEPGIFTAFTFNQLTVLKSKITIISQRNFEFNVTYETELTTPQVLLTEIEIMFQLSASGTHVSEHAIWYNYAVK